MPKQSWRQSRGWLGGSVEVNSQPVEKALEQGHWLVALDDKRSAGSLLPTTHKLPQTSSRKRKTALTWWCRYLPFYFHLKRNDKFLLWNIKELVDQHNWWKQSVATSLQPRRMGKGLTLMTQPNLSTATPPGRPMGRQWGTPQKLSHTDPTLKELQLNLC